MNTYIYPVQVQFVLTMHINYTGDLNGDDKAALAILCKIFAKKNVSDALSYIYEEYVVRQ